MKKIKEPNLKVIKFDAKDVIATSGPDHYEVKHTTNTASIIVNDCSDF